MPMIQFKKYVLQKQAEWGRSVTIQEISEACDLSRDTISRLLNEKVSRVDERTVFALCAFFQVSRGEPIPFLIYDPD